MSLQDLTLFDILARNAATWPAGEAFSEGGRRVSHREHLAAVETLAGRLAGAGLVRGDRIAALAPNGLAFAELVGAAARLGAILVGVNGRLGADEIGFILADAEPRMVVAAADAAGTVAGLVERLPPGVRLLSFGDAGPPFEPLGSSPPLSARAGRSPPRP